MKNMSSVSLSIPFLSLSLHYFFSLLSPLLSSLSLSLSSTFSQFFPLSPFSPLIFFSNSPFLPISQKTPNFTHAKKTHLIFGGCQFRGVFCYILHISFGECDRGFLYSEAKRKEEKKASTRTERGEKTQEDTERNKRG